MAESDMKVVRQWLHNNLLTMNFTKTNLINYIPNERTRPMESLKLHKTFTIICVIILQLIENKILVRYYNG